MEFLDKRHRSNFDIMFAGTEIPWEFYIRFPKIRNNEILQIQPLFFSVSQIKKN